MANILVVDDSKEWHDLIALMLKKEGYRLSHANNIAETRSILERSSFHLLILDAIMPDMHDWWEIYSWMKANANLSSIGTILTFPKMLTDLSEREKQQYNTLVNNGDEITVKPFSSDDLIATVSKVLNYYKRKLVRG